jgi:GrpB-like predicted nucleotidyltransferase (UPF0157 family)
MDTGSPSNSSSPNLEQLMQLGIQTARKGNKPNARMIFQQILDADKQNERAWLWMAAVAETPEDRFRYLRTVLRINPHNQTALRELKKMQQRRESSNSLALRYGLIGLVIILVLIALGIIAVLLMS